MVPRHGDPGQLQIGIESEKRIREMETVQPSKDLALHPGVLERYMFFYQSVHHNDGLLSVIHRRQCLCQAMCAPKPDHPEAIDRRIGAPQKLEKLYRLLDRVDIMASSRADSDHVFDCFGLISHMRISELRYDQF